MVIGVRQLFTLFRPATVVALTIALRLGSAPAAADPGVDAELQKAVQVSTAQLRTSWAADPATARRPFPALQLLPPGMNVSGACTPGPPARDPAPTALYCLSRGAVLLNHDLLALVAYRLHKQPAVAYWIAVGLAEHLQPPGATLPPAASSLQTSCLAGVLLGASGSPRLALADRWAKAAARAYGDHASETVGTSSQRAYALLSGLGATDLDCSAAAMTRLAAGQVPIPADLGTRGPGSLKLEVTCRPPSVCPPRLPSALGGV
jgi:hypothetical protein